MNVCDNEMINNVDSNDETNLRVDGVEDKNVGFDFSDSRRSFIR